MRIAMLQLRLLLLVLLSAGSIHAQSPGGVGTANLTGWWDANTLSQGNVTAWSSTFPTGGSAITLTESGAPYPQATNVPADGSSNYNTTINFDGNTSTSVMVLENQTNLNLLDQRFSTSEGSFFVAYYLPPTQVQAGCHIVNYREATSGTVDGIQLRAKLSSTTGRLAIGTGNSSNASHDWVQDFRPDIISYYGNRTGSNTLRTFQRAAEFTGGGASGTSGDVGLHLGARRAGGSNYSGMFDGYISEVIFFNRNLNPQELAQVHSYLGIKYGITLSNSTGTGDYVAPNGAIVWDASQSPTYHNEVIGLARDDASGLFQKQSRVFGEDFIAFIDNLQATNAANNGTLASNNAYVIIGNNQDSLCGQSGSGAESPPDSTFHLSRISREWKVTRTNFPEIFNLRITLDTCSGSPLVDPSLLYLLVDDDGDFSDATAYPNALGLGLSHTDGVVSITGLSDAYIPDDSVSYITIAHALPLIKIGSDTTICEGDSVTLAFSITGAPGPWNVEVFDGTGTTIYPAVMDGDQVTLSPSATTQYTVKGSGPFHCCGAQDDISTTTVTLAPAPTVTGSVFPTTVCAGELVFFTGSGALSYVWSGGVSNGTPFMPPSSGNYTVTGFDQNNCSDTDTVFVEVNPEPDPALGPDTLLCVGDTLLLDAGSFVSYAWQDGSTDSSFLVAPPAGIYTYYVTVQDSQGCTGSDSITIDVSVCLGLDDPAGNLLSISPNPTFGKIILQGMGELEMLEINIRDAYGRRVYQAEHAENEISLDLSPQAAGVYFIEVAGSGFRRVIKVIKR